jgi:hypothetical protein
VVTGPDRQATADAVRNLGIRADDRRKAIPDRHSEDLFVGVRVEGF